MKYKSLELIFKHLVYLEKHLYLLPFTAKTFESPVYNCFSTSLSLNYFATYPPTHTNTHTHTRPLSEASGGFPVSKFNGQNECLCGLFIFDLSTAPDRTGDSFLLQSLPVLGFQHAALLIFLLWWLLLSFFCCLMFDLHHLILAVPEGSILVFFLSLFKFLFIILNCGKIRITENLPSNPF